MRTLQDIAAVLDSARKQQRIPLYALIAASGLTAVTIRGLLSGKKDARLTTLMEIAERLGYEVMLVPRDVAGSLVSADDAAPAVESLVEAALTRRRESA
jgi:transcriptional regulator with XRE-family HTH domain